MLKQGDFVDCFVCEFREKSKKVATVSAALVVSYKQDKSFF